MNAALHSAFGAALATDGIGILVLAVIMAGLVRGFSGFGTAMIYMPFASTVLSPVWALITVMVFDAFGPLPLVPRALRDGAVRDVFLLLVGAAIFLPLGLFLLYHIDPIYFRWLVASVALGLLALLITGWRYHGAVSRKLIVSAGSLGGILGGIAGLAGPPVIMLYMSSNKPIQTVRANILLYLLLFDFLAVLMMGLSGMLELTPLFIGAILIIPYLAANVIGGWLFRPEREKTYRLIAYMLIFGSAVSNLPIFG